jgi:hypothetical protein
MKSLHCCIRRASEIILDFRSSKSDVRFKLHPTSLHGFKKCDKKQENYDPEFISRACSRLFSRSHSVLGLSSLGRSGNHSSVGVYEDPYEVYSRPDNRRSAAAVAALGPYSTQSLDRRLLFKSSRQRSASMDQLHRQGARGGSRNSGGGRGFADDFNLVVVGRRRPSSRDDYDLYAYRNPGSMSSMAQSAESDDIKQYRDVAL